MKSIQKAFTLIEVMIVIAIIGILAAIFIPACQSTNAKYQVGQECEILGSPVVIKAVYGNQYDVLFKSGVEQRVKEELLKRCERTR